jgi:hypothetical protein
MENMVACILYFGARADLSGVQGLPTRQFESIENAVRYAVEIMPTDCRIGAWIDVDDGRTLNWSAIKARYLGL